MVKEMNRKRTVALASLAFFVVGVTGIIYSYENYKQKFVRDLKTRIKKELQSEQAALIENIVRKEIQASRVVKNAIVREEKLQKEAYIVSDELLARYSAGSGINSPVNQDAYGKEPQYQTESELAQTDNQRNICMIESEMSSATGGSEPQPEALERTLQQKGSVLLQPGRWIVEPSFSYAHFSTNRINIQGVTILDVFTIGPISTQKIQRDIFIQTTSFKYGLMNNLQAELRIPFRYEFNRISNSDQTAETTRDDFGLGDIDFSFSRQIGWEEGWRPDIIAQIGVKSDTGDPIYNREIAQGTGHWAVRGSLVAAKSSDPAVIFGSLGYTHSFPETFTNYGRIEPGDTYSYSFGVAIALSYQTAINFSFDQSFTQKLKRGGQTVVGSFVNAANFKTGLNWAFNERSSCDLSVAIGLTDDSPDVTIDVRFPYYF